MATREFVEQLRQSGELAIVDRRVDPKFELAAVTRRIQETGERAVLFRKLAGSSNMPVVSNVYGSRVRLERLIGAQGSSSFCARWCALLDAELPDRRATCIESIAPQRVSGCLSQLPLITYHGLDAAPYLTSGVFLTKVPETGAMNLSFHRSMYVSDRELRIRLGSSHDLYRIQLAAEARSEPVEAVMLIGAAPEVFLAACSSPPYGVSELDMAAKILGRPVPMAPCRSIGLHYPTSTEIVVEGRILPGVRRPEGPFGEFMGYYVPVGDNHVFEILDVHWRPDPLMHALVCGSAEDLRPLEAVTAARIYRHVSAVVPGVIDVACKGSLLITIIKLRRTHEAQVRHALLAAAGSHLDYNKICIAVEEDVNIHDFEEVMWAFATRGRVDTRTTIIHDMPGFYRDAHRDHWGRLLIDATMPWGRGADFQRKRIPGQESIRLEDYLVDGR